LPSTPIALPQMLIGAWISAPTWLPSSRPELYPVVQLSAAPDSVADAPPSQEPSATPSRLIALPHTSIGAWIAASSWLPLRRPEL
jgi:hypothetical protein